MIPQPFQLNAFNNASFLRCADGFVLDPAVYLDGGYLQVFFTEVVMLVAYKDLGNPLSGYLQF